jgi:type II secretory pathway component GspD/PulD (secretin)
VPILSKIPWVSRLFKNVSIGREAQSLMMMVTPRIIIQEEEEAALGIELPP